MKHDATPTPDDLGLHRFALMVAGSTWLLLVAGALVTSNDAGLAVPDWPLSFGSWMPPMVGGILYEHGHRMVASFVGLLTIILAIWLWRREPRRWVRRLGLLALLAVIMQGVLGGITVLFLLPTAVSVAHACLAQLFFCAVVSLALVTSPSWKRTAHQFEDRGLPRVSWLCLLASGTIFLQLLLGALVRHRAVGVAAHVVGAVVVTLAVAAALASLYRRHLAAGPLRTTARWLLVLLIVQLGLGVGSYWIRLATKDAPQPEPAAVVLTVLHVTFGALLLAASVVLSWQAHRWLIPAQTALELPSLPEKATP